MSDEEGRYYYVVLDYDFSDFLNAQQVQNDINGYAEKGFRVVSSGACGSSQIISAQVNHSQHTFIVVMEKPIPAHIGKIQTSSPPPGVAGRDEPPQPPPSTNAMNKPSSE